MEWREREGAANPVGRGASRAGGPLAGHRPDGRRPGPRGDRATAGPLPGRHPIMTRSRPPFSPRSHLPHGSGGSAVARQTHMARARPPGTRGPGPTSPRDPMAGTPEAGRGHGGERAGRGEGRDGGLRPRPNRRGDPPPPAEVEGSGREVTPAIGSPSTSEPWSPAHRRVALGGPRDGPEDVARERGPRGPAGRRVSPPGGRPGDPGPSRVGSRPDRLRPGSPASLGGRPAIGRGHAARGAMPSPRPARRWAAGPRT